MHPNDLSKILKVVERFLRHDDDLNRVEMRCRCQDGSWKWFLASGRVVSRAFTGAAVRMIGTHIDISSLKETEIKVGIALAASESTVQAKSEFLATMSHETRTPKSGVLGLTSVLLGRRLDAIQRDLAETVQSSGQAGMDELLVGPFTAGQLTLVVAHWIALPLGLSDR